MPRTQGSQHRSLPGFHFDKTPSPQPSTRDPGQNLNPLPHATLLRPPDYTASRILIRCPLLSLPTVTGMCCHFSIRSSSTLLSTHDVPLVMWDGGGPEMVKTPPLPSRSSLPRGGDRAPNKEHNVSAKMETGAKVIRAEGKRQIILP